MFRSVNVYDFERAFEAAGRDGTFTNAGLHALFEYIEEMEDGAGTEMELDVVALCCDFAEFSSLEELQEEYSDIEGIDDLRDRTTVIEFGDGQLIIQQF